MTTRSADAPEDRPAERRAFVQMVGDAEIAMYEAIEGGARHALVDAMTISHILGCIRDQQAALQMCVDCGIPMAKACTGTKILTRQPFLSSLQNAKDTAARYALPEAKGE